MSSKAAWVTELSTLIPCWWPPNNQWCWNLTNWVVLLEEDGGQDSLQILTDLGEYLAVDRVTPEEWVHLRDAAVQSHCCLTAHHLELLVCCFSILVEHTQQALLAIVDGLLNYWVRESTKNTNAKWHNCTCNVYHILPYYNFQQSLLI